MRGAMVPRRAVPAFVAAALIVAGALALAPPCRACSCAGPSTPQQGFRGAEAAFVGTVVRDTTVAKGTTQTFEVAEVYKGALTSRVDVFAEIGTEWVSSCAVLFPAGDPVAVLLFLDEQGRWTASSCSQISVAELRRIGGEPRAPIPLASPEVGAAPGLGGAEMAPGLPAWVVIAIGAAVALGLVGAQIAWAGRRDRRAAFPSGWDPVDDERAREVET